MKKHLAGLMLLTLGSVFISAETAVSGGVISPEKARTLLSESPAVVLLDVRTAEEFASGHIAKALLLPYDEIDAASATTAIPAKTTPIVVYCRSGRRSASAAATLRSLGYQTVYDLGGISSWPYGVVK